MQQYLTHLKNLQLWLSNNHYNVLLLCIQHLQSYLYVHFAMLTPLLGFTLGLYNENLDHIRDKKKVIFKHIGI
jgi:hypothetical protein